MAASGCIALNDVRPAGRIVKFAPGNRAAIIRRFIWWHPKAGHFSS